MANKQLNTEEERQAAIEAWILEQGYPDVETYHLEGELVKLGVVLQKGDKSVRAEYDALFEDMLARGWTPFMLDGQQEIMLGDTLSNELYDKYEVYQAQIAK